MQKNYALDFFKVFFMIIIILHHSAQCGDWLVRGYIAVEFFFITSGFFLYNTYKRNNQQTALQYLKKRVIKLYPYYIVALALLFIQIMLFSKTFPYKNIISAILEPLMLQTTFIPVTGAINNPVWYISVLLTAGFIIYALLRVIPKKFFNIGAIAVIIGVYSFLIYIGQVEYWQSAFIFYIPWWRGLADLLIGVLLHQIVDRCKSKVGDNRIWIFLEVLSFAVLMPLFFIKGKLDFLAIIFIIGLIFSVTMKSVVFDHIGQTKIVRYLAKYEYVAYVNHRLILNVINTFCIMFKVPLPLHLISILVGTLIYSIVFKFVVDKGLDAVKALFEKKKKQIAK